MEKFGIYQILEALGKLSAGGAQKNDAPTAPPPPQQPAATADGERQRTDRSFLPPPSYFNARMLEIIERHESISRRIDDRQRGLPPISPKK